MVLMLGALLLSGGCSLTQPYPEKGFYGLSAAPLPQAGPAESGVLKVEPLRIARPYADGNFIYKVGQEKFTSDYYNGFVTPPGRILSGLLVQWLSGSGLYQSVVDTESSADHDLVLDGNVTELYGDYSDAKAPKAILEVKFFLIRERAAGIVVLWEKSYRAAEPLPGGGPEKLVHGWGAGYRRILEELTTDLRTASTPTTAPTASR
jgi:cholesterol transport system auxiliary component